MANSLHLHPQHCAPPESGQARGKNRRSPNATTTGGNHVNDVQNIHVKPVLWSIAAKSLSAIQIKLPSRAAPNCPPPESAPATGANDFVRVHRAAHGFKDLRKIDFPVHERFDRDFVRRVQNGWQCAADFAGLARQFDGWEPFQIRLFKCKAAESGEIGLHAFARRRGRDR